MKMSEELVHPTLVRGHMQGLMRPPAHPPTHASFRYQREDSQRRNQDERH